MVRLVTVTGVRTDILHHQLKHYNTQVNEMHVVVYSSPDNDTYSEIEKIVSEFPRAKIVHRVVEEKYNWETVTNLYNYAKSFHPHDWWVVADDDEFHVYSKPLGKIITDCDENGWEIVRGGFIDRVGPDGTFPEIDQNKNIFMQFPVAGFFRYPMSGACPNKICIMKGWVELTPGQHYAKIGDHTTWRWQGWNHPLIAPPTEYNVQVHHFKWDSTVITRIMDVAMKNNPLSYSSEYQKMYESLKESNFKIDLSEPEFMMETVGDFKYKQWNKLFNIIQSI